MMMKKIIILLLITNFIALMGSCVRDTAPKPFDFRIAIIGNPANPDIRYDEAQMTALKELGFNTIQLNIAWGARPADEPLNLEDILYVPGVGDEATAHKRLTIIKERARIAKQRGFRTLFHFGAPRVSPPLYKILRPDLIDIATETYSIQKKEIIDLYVNLLKRLKQEIPELDDIQLYTFDQEAWIANEFGDGPLGRDIPLHERIPAFLSALTTAWAEVSPNGMLWWEPWEMSAGQIYACIPQLPTKNFGMFLHSNIAEVQLTRPVDVWFRNMVILLAERNIPVTGELFMSSAHQEIDSLQRLATPRLIGEEIDAMVHLGTVSGIKEYYGMIPDIYDPNIIMAGLKIKNPSMSNKDALQRLSKPFGKNGAAVLEAWELSSQGMALFPWDATWHFSQLIQVQAGIGVFHTWDAAHIRGEVAPSPSWWSTRRSLFMLTEELTPNPWLLEDVELRCAAASAKLLKAVDCFRQVDLSDLNEPYTSYVTANISDLLKMEQIVTAIRCYCRESNLAFLMRKYVQQGEAIPDNLIRRFEAIMAIDIANQAKGYVANPGLPTAAEMLELFRKDPIQWVTTRLIFR